jgi:serine/threonine protein phosphatase 1
MAAPHVPPIQVPDGFTVWAATDLHGQRRSFDRLLAAAELTDGDDRWIAPPETALVITGDVVDRGPDSVGLVRRLASLRDQAADAGGIVAILEGNHEMQVLGGLDGHPELFRAFMAFGGGATLRSAGMGEDEWTGLSAAEIAVRVTELVPDLLPAMWSFAPYARWRDVLFVHGGPVPFQELDQFERSADRLWIRDAFFASPEPFPEAEPWEPYRRIGIGRVVFGHTQVERPTLVHDGRALNLDTGRSGRITLARLSEDADLRSTAHASEPAEPRTIRDAPLAPGAIRDVDAELPGVVDAWIATRPYRRLGLADAGSVSHMDAHGSM